MSGLVLLKLPCYFFLCSVISHEIFFEKILNTAYMQPPRILLYGYASRGGNMWGEKGIADSKEVVLVRLGPCNIFFSSYIVSYGR